MDNLSGGEKTVAALALLFSIHRLVQNGSDILFNFSPTLAINLLPSSFWMRLMLHWTIPTSTGYVMPGIALDIHPGPIPKVWLLWSSFQKQHLEISFPVANQAKLSINEKKIPIFEVALQYVLCFLPNCRLPTTSISKQPPIFSALSFLSRRSSTPMLKPLLEYIVK